ncbi:MAG: hypothetical protein QOE11_573 [Solirubrobacteraceae bacterium]|jgi:ankyrin repeat protein|nr:hypothetical protein [Solirubrobacteraceae bacterium]
MAALNGHLELVADVLGADYAGRVGDSPRGTLLHHACWVGDPTVAHRLLELGADPVAASGADFETPIAWATLGSQWHELGGRDYVAVVQTLLEAGGELEARFADVAEGPLAEWLAERAGPA